MTKNTRSKKGRSNDKRSTRRRFLRTTAIGAGTVTLVRPISATKVDSRSAKVPKVKNGKAQPTFAEDEVIREDYWIEVPLDVDQDGKRDRVHVEIARPSTTEDSDVQLPVIMEASPYFGGGNPLEFHDIDVPLYVPDKPGRDVDGPDGERRSEPSGSKAAFTGGPTSSAIGPSGYEQYFLPRGFAFAYAESLGTGESTGCPTIGDSREILGIKSVIDWLNGRAPAFDAKSGGNSITADWTTGQTGMIGTSYNGTLPNGVASTGVDGLEAIVPVSAISSWYNYYRANGHVVAPGGYQGEDTDVLFEYVLTRDNPEACAHIRNQLERRQDRRTGNYNDFWAERNYVADVENVESAVFVSHGLNDMNVKTEQFAQWYTALKEQGVPHKIILHRHGHGDWPYYVRRDAWLETLNRWWTRWLYGVENGIMDEPSFILQREDESWDTFSEWPAPEAEHVELNFTPGGRTAGGLTPRHTHGRAVTETIVDDPSITARDLAAADSSPHRLIYRTEPLADSLRLSGTLYPNLRLSFDYPAANVTTMLVDYAPDGSAYSVNRGWTDPQNRKSLRSTFAIHPGTPYKIEFNLQPDDYVFESGHRIGIVVLSSDHNFTKRPPEGTGGTVISLDAKKSSVQMPVVGGSAALAEALPSAEQQSSPPGHAGPPRQK